MKTRMIMRSVILGFIVMAAAFTACDSTFQDKSRPSFGLVSVTIKPVELVANKPELIAGAEVTPEAVPEKGNIPEPVIETNWEYPYYNMATADSRQLWFLQEEHSTMAVIEAEATPGTVISWAVGTSGARPLDEFQKTGAPLEFRNDDVIYVQVATRDGKYRNYYRIHARLASPTTLISLLTVAAGRETKIKPAEDGRDDWDEIKEDSVDELEISVTLKEGQNGSDIIATKLNDNATIRYAVVPAATDLDTVDYAQLQFLHTDKDVQIPKTELVDGKEATVYYDGAHIVFEDQDVLVAEVTAQNKTDKNYYKFRVSVGHIVNINKLEMIASTERAEVPALGVPDPTWASVVSGSFSTAIVTPAFVADITLEDEDGSFEYATLAPGATALPGSFTPATSTSTSSITYDNKEELVIRVNSATKIGGITPAATTYYKVKVNLQPALITVQPKSNVYYITSHTYPTTATVVDLKDDKGDVIETVTENRIRIDAVGTRTLGAPGPTTIEPLKAELSRTGTYTYQWYTANSWYGGYGFDKDGNIVGDVGFTIDSYHPSTARGGLDEKNNVSFHNGGNEFYRLPIGSYPDSETPISGQTYSYKDLHDALAIPGATSAEYTPVIDASKRPFIAGYSNQTQYYWVAIRDASGREVISERAAIVTEWGETFERGAPTGTKVTKKHHIVDLYAYMSPNAVGLRDKPVNTIPFKAGKHGDKHIIPITFPSGFNVKDYSVATCQAKFYLADGTVWIQNWTQGDVGFEKSGVGQVLYYNLTNNNATLGLAGDSKEPQGADLLETPTHVVLKPAGEKPITDRPPFMADGKTPRANNDAQGWFTPYIEIVELRFEGPARK